MTKEEKKPIKILKNIESVSQVASAIENLEEGQLINVTPFAESIITKDGSHMHVETVKGKLAEASLWQDISTTVKFHKKNNKIISVEKIKSKNLDLKDINSKLDEILRLIKDGKTV